MIPAPAPHWDPHKTKTSVLTEIRTVLSRAETALETIGRDPQWIVVDGYHDFTDPAHPVYVEDVLESHPDGPAMVAALDATIAALSAWRGPAKRRGPR